MRTQSIHAAVGPSQPNMVKDVELVQDYLNHHSLATQKRVKVNGVYGASTDLAIRAFQRDVLGMPFPDGVVRVGGLTLERLKQSSMGQFCTVSPWLSSTCKVGLPTAADYAAAAETLDCEVAAIKAVADVESSGKGGFYPLGRPVCRYERHIFRRYTGGIYDRDFPDLSNSKPGGYGDTSLTEQAADVQYGKLARALFLDEDAALESASYGAFQLMGFNYDACGFSSVRGFVVAMTADMQSQLTAFTNFVQSKNGAQKALQGKKWADFASAYNGAKWRTTNPDYDTQMAHAYAKESKALSD